MKPRKQGAVVTKGGRSTLTNHYFVSDTGKPGCIYCTSLTVKRLGGWRGRDTLAKMEAEQGMAPPPGATAYECRACFKVFVAINDPDTPTGRIA